MRIMTDTIFRLQPSVIKSLKSYAPPLVYSIDQEIHYEGHIPIVGYLILDGQIKLTKNDRLKLVLEAGHLFGLTELMNRMPFDFTAKVSKQSRICYLDRSTILEIMESEDQLSRQFLDSVLCDQNA